MRLKDLLGRETSVVRQQGIHTIALVVISNRSLIDIPADLPTIPCFSNILCRWAGTTPLSLLIMMLTNTFNVNLDVAFNMKGFEDILNLFIGS